MAEKKEIKFYGIDNITQATEKDSLYAVKGKSENFFKLYVTDLYGNLIPLFTVNTSGSITNITSSDSSISVSGGNIKDLKVSTSLQNIINSALQSNDPISSLLNDSGYLTLTDLPTFNPSDYDLSEFTNVSSDPFVKQSELVSGTTDLSYTPSPTNGIVTSSTGSDATIPLADNTNAGLIDSAEKNKISTAIQPSDLGAVATSNDYTDLDNIPTTFTPSSHTHVEADITDLDKYTQSETDNLLNTKFDNPAGNNTQYLDGSGTPTTFPIIPDVNDFVPYTGANQNVDLGTNELKADALEVSLTPTGAVDAGKIAWNVSDGTFDMGLLNGVTLQSGQEIHFYAKASGAISNGDCVQFAGSQGEHLLIKKAVQSEINLNPEYFIGIATQDFANNEFGYVTVLGKVRMLNTSSWTQPVLYFDSSGSTAGALTQIQPTAPNAKIIVCAVARVHATQGILMVRPHTMPRLKDMQDSHLPTPSDNDSIVWNNSNSRYENKALISNTITEDVTDKAPNENAVFDALFLKEDKLTSAYSMKANNTNATANSTEFYFRVENKKALSDSGFSYIGSVAPYGTFTGSYSWMLVGNFVMFQMAGFWANPGTAITSLIIPFPSDMPFPVRQNGFTGSVDRIATGIGYLTTTNQATGNGQTAHIRAKTTGNSFEIIISASSVAAKSFSLAINYPIS